MAVVILLYFDTFCNVKFVVTQLRDKEFFIVIKFYSGPGSSVGIETGYGLNGSGIVFRWRRNFLHLSRPALGPTYVACCTMSSGSFSGGKKRPGRDAEFSPPF
jgi:hypothetical protein